MKRLPEFIKSLKRKNIHVVGVTGAEGSSILNLLVKYNLKNITTHDFIDEGNIERNFKIWHKGIAGYERNIYYKNFLNNLTKVNFYDQKKYLENITLADIIFVPQSWRRYPQNRSLWQAKKKGILFYSLTRLYLDFSSAFVLAVTGTVGKGSTTTLIYEVLKRSGKSVYFTGNETWRIQLADKLDTFTANDYLILEVSHRQLIDGFTKAPEMVVFTNLYPNHLDEITWDQYQKVKLSLVRKQTRDDMAVLNYDDQYLKKVAKSLNSKIYYYSQNYPDMNIKDIQKIYNNIMGINSNHYINNILAASTSSILLGIPSQHLVDLIKQIPVLPARLEVVSQANGITVYDDIKSTTPWSTIAAIHKLSGKIILILGGDTKKIKYDQLINLINEINIKTIFLKSQLSDYLKKDFPHLKLKIVADLFQAVREAFNLAKYGDKILISPAAANFYTQFIKDKQSIKKIIGEFT